MTGYADLVVQLLFQWAGGFSSIHECSYDLLCRVCVILKMPKEGVFILKTRHNQIHIKTGNYFSTANKVVLYVEKGRETFDWLVPSQLIS